MKSRHENLKADFTRLKDGEKMKAMTELLNID